MDFKILEKTGLRQKGELETIFGVSRVMINGYAAGRSLPRGRNRTRAQYALRVLAALVDKGKLPFPEGKEKQEREAAVKKIAAYVGEITPPAKN